MSSKSLISSFKSFSLFIFIAKLQIKNGNSKEFPLNNVKMEVHLQHLSSLAEVKAFVVEYLADYPT